jgi:hypothetical protein
VEVVKTCRASLQQIRFGSHYALGAYSLGDKYVVVA